MQSRFPRLLGRARGCAAEVLLVFARMVDICQPVPVGRSTHRIVQHDRQSGRRLHDRTSIDENGLHCLRAPRFRNGIGRRGDGFDGSAFVCFDPETGERNWRADGYGNGQVLLLADSDLLLILSERGVAALVEARPAAHREIGRFQAINGKTWNHPVIAHGKLFVRNGEEIACYQVR